MATIRTASRAGEVGERMGRGGIPPYSRADWREVYPGSPDRCFAAYKQGYRAGWRTKRQGR